MRESKAELTDRLRREGRFEAFKKRREELKVGGMAASEAWDAAATEFPPPVAQHAAGEAPTVDLRALMGKPTLPVAEAATWASEHLDADWVSPADAPSAGAWSMREWARSSMAARSEFYRTFVAKLVMPPQEEARRAKEEADAHHSEFYRKLFGDPKPISMAESQATAVIDRLLADGHGES